jgi:hypothetical protein
MLTFASAPAAAAENSTEAKPEAAQQSPKVSPENSLLQRQATLSGVGVLGGGRFAPRNTNGGRRRNSEPSDSGIDAETSPKTYAGPDFAFARLPVTPPLIQFKLNVSSANDPFELEADAVAERVMRKAEPAPVTSAPPTVQRKCTTCSDTPSPCPECDEEGKSLQREATGAAPTEAPPSVSDVLAQPGAPLPADVRAYMEPRFETDFGGVRIHSGGEAARSADAVSARAYTVGQHIVFASGAYAPESDDGRRLIAHELTHVLQQRSGLQRLQRSTTRGAGGCASPDALDEDDDGPKGAGRTAHTQIQNYLLPGIINEIEIPRATKRNIGSLGCQPLTRREGYADLYQRGGSQHQIAEIKPIRTDMSRAEQEADHYMRRAGQSMDRFFGTGAVCPGATAGADDTAFARRVGVSRLQPTFARMTGILAGDTVIGRFDGDPSRTLKARLHSAGAVGYWCTGGQSDTYTCGVSDEETQRYIDRFALEPAQSLLEEFLRENVERQLERVLAARNLGEILAIAERHFGATIRQQMRPYLGPMADQILNQASAEALGRLIEESMGPEARAIVLTIIRRLTSLIVAELRTLLRNALAGMIREALAALCVGVPAVALAELLDRLRQSFRDVGRTLVPVAVAAVTVQIIQWITAELAAMVASMMAALNNALGVIGDILSVVGEILLRALAAIGVLLLCVGVIVLAIAAFALIFDPAPGDEVAVGAAAAALARLIPPLGGFVLRGSFT